MKLYQLHRNSYFILNEPVEVPPDAPPVISGAIYKLIRIDGMYSHCLDGALNRVHIPAYAEVLPVDAE